jgi:hypothetical protein
VEPSSLAAPDSVTGKLKVLCPSFYFTLIAWERDSLDSITPLVVGLAPPHPPPKYREGSSSCETIPLPAVRDKSVTSLELVNSSPLVERLIVVSPSGNSSPSGGLRTEVATNLLETRDGSSEEERDCSLLLGYRESEPSECSLGETLESFMLLHREVDIPRSLPIFQGRNVYNYGGPGHSGKLHKPGGDLGSDFSWSKGLGFETSPIKTQSARKKASGSLPATVSLPTSVTDIGALRGMKALARAKP